MPKYWSGWSASSNDYWHGDCYGHNILDFNYLGQRFADTINLIEINKFALSTGREYRLNPIGCGCLQYRKASLEKDLQD